VCVSKIDAESRKIDRVDLFGPSAPAVEKGEGLPLCTRSLFLASSMPSWRVPPKHTFSARRAR
jgi:hypothetical protein